MASPPPTPLGGKGSQCHTIELCEPGPHCRDLVSRANRTFERPKLCHGFLIGVATCFGEFPEPMCTPRYACGAGASLYSAANSLPVIGLLVVRSNATATKTTRLWWAPHSKPYSWSCTNAILDGRAPHKLQMRVCSPQRMALCCVPFPESLSNNYHNPM